MEQMDLLWQYQNLDILVDICEAKRKSSPLRQKLLSLKNNLTEQQALVQAIEEETVKKNAILSQIGLDYETWAGLINKAISESSGKDKTTVEQLKKMIDEAQEIKHLLSRKEADLKRILTEMEIIEKKLEALRSGAAVLKSEYSSVKAKYDEELEVFQLEYSKAKNRRDLVGVQIDHDLLTKYSKLKDKRSNVISLIENDRCGSCNMMLAAIVLQNMRDKKEVIECENCGRILFLSTKSS